MPSPYGLELVESCVACKLRRDGYFCSLPRQSYPVLDSIKLANVVPKGTILFSAGQKPVGIHLVCAGRVKVYTQEADGKMALVKIVGAGELLGLHASLAGMAHEFTAETVQASQVVVVKNDDFRRFLGENDEACWKAARILSHNCHDAYQIIRSGGGRHSASAKLARLLLEIASAGRLTGEGIEVILPLTHNEIAQAIGMSRETVWRKLVEFRNSGVAILRGSVLLIQNKAELQRLAGR